jgi:hypothetical protein
VFAVVVGARERSDLPRIDEAFLAEVSRATHQTGQTRLYIMRH